MEVKWKLSRSEMEVMRKRREVNLQWNGEWRESETGSEIEVKWKLSGSEVEVKREVKWNRSEVQVKREVKWKWNVSEVEVKTGNGEEVKREVK